MVKKKRRAHRLNANGRKPSNKCKHSKVKKLIKLAKMKKSKKRKK